MLEHNKDPQNDDDNVVMPTVTYQITLKPHNSIPWVYWRFNAPILRFRGITQINLLFTV